MSTLTVTAARAQADQATAETRAAADMADRYLAVEAEEAAHRALQADPAAAAALDAEMTAAEARPEAGGLDAQHVRAQLAAETLAWFRDGPQAETEAEAG